MFAYLLFEGSIPNYALISGAKGQIIVYSGIMTEKPVDSFEDMKVEERAHAGTSGNFRATGTDFIRKLSRFFYDRDTITVASELLGKYLVRVFSGIERIGRIVEVEAYPGPFDLASHSSKGLTKVNDRRR